MIIAFFLVVAVNAVITGLIAAVIWMFTTVVGLVLLGIFVLIFIGNLFSPDNTEGEDK